MNYKNEIIQDMYNNLKLKVKELSEKLEDSRITNEGNQIFQFVNGVLNDEQFKFNLSIPSDLQDKNDYLGTYISINIPQLTSVCGILFKPNQNDKFNVQLTGGYEISFIDEIQNNAEIDFKTCLEIADKIIDLFHDTYEKRQKLIEKIIKEYFDFEDAIKFSEIEIDFFSPVTEGRNKYLYYYDREKNIVFLNDIFKTNYKSVINGIEEIATGIVNKEKIKYFDSLKWKNIFININNSGIIIQDIKLKPEFESKKKASFFSNIFQKKEPENVFLAYRRGADFDTDCHVPFNEVVTIWKELDIEGL